jgi:hypothetical protein
VGDMWLCVDHDISLVGNPFFDNARLLVDGSWQILRELGFFDSLIRVGRAAKLEHSVNGRYKQQLQ